MKGNKQMTKKTKLALAIGAGVVGVIALIFIINAVFGKKKLPVDSTVKVEFSGVDGYGQASIVGASDWMDSVSLTTDGDEWQQLGTALVLDSAVSYSLSESEGLSNGDVIKLEIKVDKETLKQYGYKAKNITKKYKVKGLGEIKEFDPFEDMDVVISGTAPYTEVEVTYSNSKVSGIEYVPDVTEGVTNGDKIKIKIKSSTDEDILECCGKQGYKPTKTETTYEVKGLNAYVQKLDDIPEDSLKKIKSQCSDIIASETSDWEPNDNEYKNRKQYIGHEYVAHYVFQLKEGLEPNLWSSNTGSANKITMLYKIKANGNEGEFEYFYAITFEDGQLAEGTNFTIDLTKYNKTRDEFTKGKYQWTGKWMSGEYDESYVGYQDYDSFYNKEVASKLEQYTYETNYQK